MSNRKDYQSNDSLPFNKTGGMNKWEPGKLPNGGFQAIIPFGGQGTKKSPTTKPEPQNRIIKG